MSNDYVSKLLVGSGEEVDIRDEAAVHLNELFDLIYPVGTIYMSVSDINPGNIFGGTWVVWGSGLVPVGVDTSQTEFNIVEKSGGSKYLQEHRHSFNQPEVSGGGISSGITGGKHRHQVWRALKKVASGSVNIMAPTHESSGEDVVYATYTDSHTHNLPAHTHTVKNGTVMDVSDVMTGAAGNLQPYITCYMWKRTA